LKIRIENIKQSDYKNIYVVGDIHGMFHLLEMYLTQIGFNKELDLLICCGDLVDRGKNSDKAKDYIRYPWFKSVMGNHDLKFTPLSDNPSIEPCPIEHFEETIDYHTYADFHIAFENLPIAIEIKKTNNKKVVCLHAEMPLKFETWSDFKSSLLLRNPYSINKCLWGRDISTLIKFENKTLGKNLNLLELVDVMKHNHLEFIDNYFLITPDYKERLEFYRNKLKVQDVEAMFHGHSVLNADGIYGKFANRYLIETGAFLTETFIRQNGEKYIPSIDNLFGFTIFDINNLNKPKITPNNFIKLL
jgi:serine/threonine protein phosphatase 1